MMLWAWAGVPLGVYNIVSDFNIALRIQPQILTLLSLLTWIQCLYYEARWSLARCFTTVLPIAAVMAGMQTGLILALRIAHARHLEWPLTLMAVLSALLLALGVLRHYWDIWVHRTVRGISFLFVAIDAAGDVLSLLAVLFQARWDVLGMVIYATELVLWMGIMAAGAWYNLRPWAVKKAEEWRARQAVETEAAGDRGGIAIHDLPSSTSVFRTASAELSAARQRISGVRRSGSREEQSNHQRCIELGHLGSPSMR